MEMEGQHHKHPYVDGPQGPQPNGFLMRVFDRWLPAPALEEHVSFKRMKLSLLTIGVAVTLVANVCYLGFADPPEGPQVPLISFDAEVSEVDYDNLNDTAPKSMIQLLYSKIKLTEVEGDYDYSDLSIDEYVALYATVNRDAFCDNKLLTAFRVLNGIAFALAMATLFLVAVVPVFVTKHAWDLHLARIGAIFMTFCILAFLAAFLLAGFVTIGMGVSNCDTVANNGKEKKEQQVVSASAYATLGFACALVILVLYLAVKG